MNRKFILVYTAITLLVAQTAWADLKVTWSALKNDVDFTIEYRDSNNIRMGIQQGMYVLMQGDNLYAVNEDRILDVHAFAHKLQEMKLTEFFANRMHERSKRIPPASGLKPLNQTETVAGIHGEVFEVTRPPAKKGEKTENYEIVLTQDQRLVDLKLAMQQWTKANSERLRQEGFSQMREAMQDLIPPQMAIIRYGDKFQISEIADTPLEDSRFELPTDYEIRTSPTLADISTAIRVMMPLARSD